MLLRWSYRFPRTILTLSMLAVLLLSLAQPVIAAPRQLITLKFDIVAVKLDESVTVRTVDFPLRTNFTVTIGLAGNLARKGVEVGTFNSAEGGKIEKTFPIPAEFHGKKILGVRIESRDGYTAFNWFFNRTQSNLVKDPDAPKPEMTFSGVKKNQVVTVEVKNLPPDEAFRVRIGPHHTFYQDYVSVETVTSEANGTLRFTIELPKNVQDKEYVGVRLDGGGTVSYATFQNVDGGTLVPPQALVQVVPCTVVNIAPVPALDPRADFDAVWTVQNTAPYDWEVGTVDFMFVGGEKMHKYEDVYDLNWEIKRGAVFDLAVDMLAPVEPGYHRASWAIVQANRTLCTLNITVFVKQLTD